VNSQTDQKVDYAMKSTF